ncbi:hypothetical protein MHD_01295 [Mannheimia granulomatis]|nr:restriction endonuclease [Mannheimia granulomatis]RGE49144.1 hypothetical protein MHD_01295 [Mannheimia granulomatis]
MSVIDFKEIPEAHKGGGNQDSFELFAHSFMQKIGVGVPYEINRGADGGIDFLLEEDRKGSLGTTTFKWLVSCKHKAFSGKAVQPIDEEDLFDRVNTNNCQGFIGFYSTVVSSGLKKKFDELRRKRIEVKIFDKEAIETEILKGFQFDDPLKFNEMKRLAERFFPKSTLEWIVNNPRPAFIFYSEPTLKCCNCKKELLGRDIFKKRSAALVTVWYEKNEDGSNKTELIEGEEVAVIGQVVWSCKGACDSILEADLLKKFNYAGWCDLGDYLLPPVYLRNLNSFMLGIFHNTYKEEAIVQGRELMNNIFPFISRHLNDDDKEEMHNLMMIPPELGGWR